MNASGELIYITYLSESIVACCDEEVMVIVGVSWWLVVVGWNERMRRNLEEIEIQKSTSEGLENKKNPTEQP